MDSPKTVKGSNWFGRKQKQKSSGRGPALDAENSEPEVLGTFGVPLELCPTSSANEVQ